MEDYSMIDWYFFQGKTSVGYDYKTGKDCTKKDGKITYHKSYADAIRYATR